MDTPPTATHAGAITVRPVTPDRWDDLAALFGPSGAYSGCWCMWWRTASATFAANGNAGNRAALAAIVADGRVPGLLAYVGDRPVGWVALAPREQYGRLQRSPVLKPVDDTPVWAITCFFVARADRGQGVAAALLRAAIDYVAGQGGGVLESYPVDPGAGRIANASAFTGVPALFAAASFREVARRKERRPIMRLTVPAAPPVGAPR